VAYRASTEERAHGSRLTDDDYSSAKLKRSSTTLPLFTTIKTS
jgi:hypothetical protein